MMSWMNEMTKYNRIQKWWHNNNNNNNNADAQLSMLTMKLCCCCSWCCSLQLICSVCCFVVTITLWLLKSVTTKVKIKCLVITNVSILCYLALHCLSYQLSLITSNEWMNEWFRFSATNTTPTNSLTLTQSEFLQEACALEQVICARVFLFSFSFQLYNKHKLLCHINLMFENDLINF